MRTITITFALLASYVLAPIDAVACSKVGLHLLGNSHAVFTGTAMPDTLPAGRGAISYGTGGGHYGRGAKRSIFGQRVIVDRIGGPAAAGLPAGVREMVVVPWDYDGACDPLPWGRSARWVQPGTRGLYIASLRPAEHWVDGIPTLDVHEPGAVPYTGVYREPPPRGETASLLSPDELFGLYQALPPFQELRDDGPRSIAALRSWVAAHPGLAARPPAEFLLGDVRNYLRAAELRNSDHPVLGTWRFTLRLPGDSSRVFYARTEDAPDQEWGAHTQEEAAADVLKGPPAQGYSFRVTIATRLEGLPGAPRRADANSNGSMAAMVRADSTAAGEVAWGGAIDSSILSQAFPRHPLVREAVTLADSISIERYVEGFPEEVLARYFRGSDGILHVRQSFPLRDGRELVLEGEQVSRAVIRSKR